MLSSQQQDCGIEIAVRRLLCDETGSVLQRHAADTLSGPFHEHIWLESNSPRQAGGTSVFSA